MDKTILFIFNRLAGKGKISKNVADIIDIFTRAGYVCTVITTQHQDHMMELISEKAVEYDMVVISGGDGSLQEAVTGLVSIPQDERPLLGYIPAGSTNDFARSMGIPSNMIKAAEHIATGNRCFCDVGAFGDEYFTYVAAFGAFTEVTYATPQEYKNLIGHQAYYIEGVKSLQNIKPIKLRVELDEEIIEGTFLYGMVSNSKSVGGIRNWVGKDIVLDDGIFELTLVRFVDKPIELNEVIPQLFTGRTSEFVIRRKCRHVHFVMNEKVDWVLDGEFGGSLEEVSISVMQKEIEICV